MGRTGRIAGSSDAPAAARGIVAFDRSVQPHDSRVVRPDPMQAAAPAAVLPRDEENPADCARRTLRPRRRAGDAALRRRTTPAAARAFRGERSRARASRDRRTRQDRGEAKSAAENPCHPLTTTSTDR